jgi:hypothetical protein
MGDLSLEDRAQMTGNSCCELQKDWGGTEGDFLSDRVGREKMPERSLDGIGSRCDGRLFGRLSSRRDQRALC